MMVESAARTQGLISNEEDNEEDVMFINLVSGVTMQPTPVHTYPARRNPDTVDPAPADRRRT